MATQVEALKTQLAGLPREDRADLAYYLIHSLDDEESSESPESVEEAWIAELNRRDAEIDQGQADGEPAESVFAQLRQAHRHAG